MKPLIIVLTLSGLMLISCAPPASLSTAMLREYKLSTADITRLQLYVSEGILLEKEATTINKDIDEKHSLKTVEDSRVQQIYFKRLTPCVAVDAASDRLRVAFEDGDDLVFRLKYTKDGSGGIYVYQPETAVRGKGPDRLPGSGFDNWKIIGRETYKDEQYYVLVQEDLPCILVDEQGLKKLDIDRKTVPGMKLKGR